MNLANEFICPDCKHTVIERVSEGATITGDVVVLDDEIPEEFLSFTTCIEEEYTARFQCKNCGYIIKDVFNRYIDDPEDLAEWILDSKKEREVNENRG